VRWATHVAIAGAQHAACDSTRRRTLLAVHCTARVQATFIISLNEFSGGYLACAAYRLATRWTRNAVRAMT